MTDAGALTHRPEILAPAGDPLAMRAALAAGADAVYLGMARFNARGRAERFRGVTLRACVDTAHEHGARVHVTLNTLLHDDELPVALDLAHEAERAGVDAVIVQDLALAAALRRDLPSLAVHASTQMAIHQAEQAATLAAALGLRRVILARECSVDEVRRVARRLHEVGAELEVFVHGALCYAYSGQCLMSNFAGRRSANRGICAQNCRFDFTCGASGADGSTTPLPAFDRRSATQLLSMKDLAAFGSIAALADAGVASLKVEGRLKGPEYVAEVVRLYRAALDAWAESRAFSSEEAARAAGRVFSRGFTNGYLEDAVDAESMRGDKRLLEGEPDIIIRRARRKEGLLWVEPRPGHEVAAGQGYRYAHDRYRGGFRVVHVDAPPGSGPSSSSPVAIRVRFGSDAAGRRHRRGATGRTRPPPPLPAGLAAYLNDDPTLQARIDALVARVDIRAAELALDLVASGREGEPLLVTARAADGRTAEARSDAPLEASRARSLDAALLEDHLGRFGGTPYRLRSLDASGVAPNLFLGFPALHAVRRALAESFDRQSEAMPRSPPIRREVARDPEAATRVTTLRVRVGSIGALDAAFAAGADAIVIDATVAFGADDVVRRIAEGAAARPGAVWIGLPAIVHDATSDAAHLDAVASRLPGAGVLAGHAGQIALARERDLVVDADLWLNSYSAAAAGVLAELGARAVALSLEVDAKEAARAQARTTTMGGGGRVPVEVVVGGRVFSMLTRQPHGLASGESFGATSEHGHGYILERVGETTVLWEARELVGAALLPTLAGRVDLLRLELAHRDPADVGDLTRAWRAALDAQLAGAPDANEKRLAAERLHRERSPRGTFEGHLVRGARTQDD